MKSVSRLFSAVLIIASCSRFIDFFGVRGFAFCGDKICSGDVQVCVLRVIVLPLLCGFNGEKSDGKGDKCVFGG